MKSFLVLGKKVAHLRSLLEDGNFGEVLCLRNEKKAIEALNSHALYDAIFLYQDFPDSDLKFFLARLMAFDVDIPVLYVHLPGQPMHVQDLFRWNIQYVLREPLVDSEVAFAIAKARQRTEETAKRNLYELQLLDMHYKFNVLADIVSSANTSLDKHKVIASIMSKIEDIIKCEGWSLLLLNEQNDKLVFAASRGIIGEKLKGIEIPAEKGVVGRVIRDDKPLIINSISQKETVYRDIDYAYDFTTHSILCIPLKSRGRIIGAIELVNKKYHGEFSQKDLDLLKILSEPAAIALENSFLYEKTKELTIMDDLTQLYNSRFLNMYLDTEIERARRMKEHVSMIFFDIDGFKNVNDKYGHLAGSQVLNEVGRLLTGNVRKMDIPVRYGGDEFILILPETDSQNAIKIASRLRQAVNANTFLRNQDPPYHLTASFGISCFPDNAGSKEELINNADKSMYYVKENGKDGVNFYLHKNIMR